MAHWRLLFWLAENSKGSSEIYRGSGDDLFFILILLFFKLLIDGCPKIALTSLSLSSSSTSSSSVSMVSLLRLVAELNRPSGVPSSLKARGAGVESSSKEFVDGVCWRLFATKGVDNVMLFN